MATEDKTSFLKAEKSLLLDLDRKCSCSHCDSLYCFENRNKHPEGKCTCLRCKNTQSCLYHNEGMTNMPNNAIESAEIGREFKKPEVKVDINKIGLDKLMIVLDKDLKINIDNQQLHNAEKITCELQPEEDQIKTHSDRPNTTIKEKTLKEQIVSNDTVYAIDSFTKKAKILSQKQSKLTYKGNLTSKEKLTNAHCTTISNNENFFDARLVHNFLLSYPKQETTSGAAKLSAQIMNLPYNKSFQSWNQSETVPKKGQKLSSFDIFKRIKDAYNACSCKVCECIGSKILYNKSDKCSCKPCECLECSAILVKPQLRNSPCVVNYSTNASLCKCKPCECIDCLLVGSMKSCDCKDCQCMKCRSMAIHRTGTILVGAVSENHSPYDCNQCECTNCANPFFMNRARQEMSTGTNRHSSCRCEMCNNEECVPEGTDTCGCYERKSVIKKPVAKSLRDFDIRRVSVGNKRDNSKTSRLTHDTITMYTTLTSNYHKLTSNNSSKKTHSLFEINNLKDKQSLKAKKSIPIKNDTILTYLNNNVCVCSSCECQVCTNIKESEPFLQNSSKKGKPHLSSSWENRDSSSQDGHPHSILVPKTTVEQGLNDVLTLDTAENLNLSRFRVSTPIINEEDLQSTFWTCKDKIDHKNNYEEVGNNTTINTNSKINIRCCNKNPRTIANTSQTYVITKKDKMSYNAIDTKPLEDKHDQVEDDIIRAQKTLHRAREFSLELIDILLKYKKANKEFKSINKVIRKKENEQEYDFKSVINNILVEKCEKNIAVNTVISCTKDNNALFLSLMTNNIQVINNDPFKLQEKLYNDGEKNSNSKNYHSKSTAVDSKISDINITNNENYSKLNDNTKNNSYKEYRKIKVNMGKNKLKNRLSPTSALGEGIRNNSHHIRENSIREQEYPSTLTTQTKTLENHRSEADFIFMEEIKKIISDLIEKMSQFKESSTQETQCQVYKNYSTEEVFNNPLLQVDMPKIEKKQTLSTLKQNYKSAGSKLYPQHKIEPVRISKLETKLNNVKKSIDLHSNEGIRAQHENETLCKIKELQSVPTLQEIKEQYNLEEYIYEDKISKGISSMESSKSSREALKVEFQSLRRISDHTVMMKWNTPEDVSLVDGYEILVDGRAVQKMLSPTRRMAVITCLPHCDKVLLTIRTITTKFGKLCPATTVIYRPRVK